MKHTRFIICLLVVLSMFSCQKENELGNLPGTWKFGSAFVNGQGTSASGNIYFDATNKGDIDIWVIVAEDTVYHQGDFTYTETLESVDLLLNNSSLLLERRDNKRKAQEFLFKETIDNIEYEVTLDMIPE